LDTLDNAHLDAVIAHEQAHFYWDTFWFFWLGWVLHCHCCNTESLWQELLILREVRADHWAAQQVDPLLLAESLLRGERHEFDAVCKFLPRSARLLKKPVWERIEALLAEPSDPSKLMVLDLVTLSVPASSRRYTFHS